MKLTTEQSKFIDENKDAILATANKAGEPRAILVELNKYENDEIVITDNAMKITKENFLQNNKVFVLVFNKDYSLCLKISGQLSYQTKGNCADWVRGLETNKNWKPFGALVIKINNIIECR